jgi:bacillolysin
MTLRPSSAAPLFFLVLVLASACAPAPAAQPAQGGVRYLDDREQGFSALRRIYGSLSLREHPQLGTVAALEFAAPARLNFSSSVSVSTAVRDFVLRYRPIFGLGAADTLETRKSTTDRLGMRHVSFTQRRFGVTVWGSRLDAHLRSVSPVSVDLLRLHGHLQPLPILETDFAQPTLSTEEARQIALGKARSKSPTADVGAYVPALYYLAQGERLRLVYRVEVYGQLEGLPLRDAYFIDAHNGTGRDVEDLVARIDMTVPAQGSGRGALGTDYKLSISLRGDTYSLQDPTRGGQRTTRVSPSEKLPGRTLTSDAADRWDSHPTAPGLAVDVHAHVATLWDYFATRHAHYGWDGEGHGLTAVAHVGDRKNVALSDSDRLLFGDGDGRDYAPLGAALDVVAHEYVHAVIRSSCDLANRGDSGAIAESFANLFACLIEQSVRPETTAWTLGEEIYHPGGHPDVLADLADPRGGSGPLGHAGYLLARELGIERAASIVYRALVIYLFRYAEYADAADALGAAAHDLYGEAARSAVKTSLNRAGL